MAGGDERKWKCVRVLLPLAISEGPCRLPHASQRRPTRVEDEINVPIALGAFRDKKTDQPRGARRNL